METEIKDLKDKCPAFVEKCPFDKPELKPLIEEAKKCPAFKDDCTFKNATTIEEVYQKLSNIPDVKDGSTHQKALAEILKVIHSVSSELKEEMGECPVFKSKVGCPFKTICSDGKPLLEKLKQFHLEHLVHDAVIEAKEELNSDLMKEKETMNLKMSGKTEDGTEDLKLSSHLKTVLSKDHRQASTSHFIKDLLKGRIEQKIYQQYIAALYFIYSALEEEAQKNADHPVFGRINCPEDLARVELLKKDLKYFFGNDWEEYISISAATQNYVDRLHEVGQTDPELLVAHHYIRYVGDLSGGQIVKKVAIKTYGLPQEGDGVRFYEFKNIQNYSKYKDLYRGKLDDLQVSRETADRFVEESRFAYDLNVQLFKEMDMLAGFEEEIVHEEVEAVPNETVQDEIDNSVDVKNVPESQQKSVKSDYVQWAVTAGMGSNPDKKADSNEEQVVKENSAVEWLKVLAALAIAVAVLAGFAMKMMGDKL